MEWVFYLGIGVILFVVIRDVWISWRDGEFGDE